MNEENKNLEEFFDEEDNANEMNDFGRETKSWPLTVITVVILAIIALIIGGITYLSTANRLEKNKKETIDEMYQVEAECMENADQISGEMIDELNSIKDYLTSVEESISANESLLSEYSETSENGYSELSVTYKDSTQKIGNDFSQMNSQIKTTKENIETLIKELEGKGSTNQNELKTQYNTIKESITTIDKEFSDSHEKINDLIKELSSKEDSNSKELASKLKTMESSLSKIETENMSQIKDTLTDMEDKYTKLISDLEALVNADFDELDQTINNKFDSLSLSFTQGNDSTKEELDKINENIQLVFQFVSDGKELIASAITDKGVAQNKDAIFSVLANGISLIGTDVANVESEKMLEGTRVYDGLNNSYVDGSMPDRGAQEDFVPSGIDQRTYESGYYPNSWTVDTTGAYNRGYTDGKADVPNAHISYIYHEHKLGDGTVVSADYISDHEDGCICQPVYNIHHHSGSSAYGGGCYSIRHEEEVDEHCGGSATTDWGVGYGEYWYCNKCGARMDGNYGQCQQVTGHHTEVYYTLGCGKAEGGNDGINHYRCGCGKTDYATAGEDATISEATIVFD
ncbi:MAG: hypothetical protein IKQ44_00960 [Lachnospiraceae bacterium]|nr:hypothetical protein [Lachnospiraceae bacterium]